MVDIQGTLDIVIHQLTLNSGLRHVFFFRMRIEIKILSLQLTRF